MKVPDVLQLLEHLEEEMKSYEFGIDMVQRRINDSFALVAVQALQAYLRGDVDAAAADFAMIADEMRARRGLKAGGDGSPPSRQPD